MINFLKASPQKFDHTICESFLSKMGLLHAFTEVVDLYMADFHSKIDLGGVESFISETNLVDLSNRSVLKTLDRNRRTEVKRASDIHSVLRFLDDEAPQPSKHIVRRKRDLKSCPPLGRNSSSIVKNKVRTPRAGSRPRKAEPRVKKLLARTIEPITMLFINEITQVQAQKLRPASGLNKR